MQTRNNCIKHAQWNAFSKSVIPTDAMSCKCCWYTNV